MTMIDHYKSNVRDIFFNLFEVLDISETTLSKEPFTGMDEESVREAIAGLDTFVKGELAPSFAESDRVPLKLDEDGNVTLPPGLRKSIDAYYRDEWGQLELPEHLGGFGAPPSVSWAAFELVTGANPCVGFYLLGNFMAKIIDALGTDAQKKRYVKPMLDRHWGGTMALTESDAGSNVGVGRSKAVHVEGDEYHLEGSKIFITNGDFDQPENIVHLVLARPEGAGPGTKGLSMFIVPKFWVEEDGSLGARNGAVVTNIEKKMGIKGSATCELTLGAQAPCRALLVGEAHDGIRQMFNVIEYARMAVGTKSMATLSTAYLNALAYTKERVQGPDLLKASDKTAPSLEVIGHPDVRRMLMSQKSYSEGMRALVIYTAWIQDQVAIVGGPSTPEGKTLEKRNDLLLPLVKGYCSDKGWEVLSTSLQCFGGAGFLQDYPIEQYIRDQKIDTLYEGTTHIQALDLFFRKIGRDQGTALKGLFGDIQNTLESLASNDGLSVERDALA
ncbi:MAG: acyl-CoA dehydrogenase, partial [Myxococcales bacterium]|nr:acyl-CoA dehydrogenase [Myxococcales bacterium]